MDGLSRPLTNELDRAVARRWVGSCEAMIRRQPPGRLRRGIDRTGAMTTSPDPGRSSPPARNCDGGSVLVRQAAITVEKIVVARTVLSARQQGRAAGSDHEATRLRPGTPHRSAETPAPVPAPDLAAGSPQQRLCFHDRPPGTRRRAPARSRFRDDDHARSRSGTSRRPRPPGTRIRPRCAGQHRGPMRGGAGWATPRLRPPRASAGRCRGRGGSRRCSPGARSPRAPSPPPRPPPRTPGAGPARRAARRRPRPAWS